MPDFPYINARVRAMRSRLLDPGRIEELLALPSIDALLLSPADLQRRNGRGPGEDLRPTNRPAPVATAFVW